MNESKSLSSSPSLLALRSQETGHVHKLSGEVLIGREVECDIQLRSIQVSRYHAKIIVAANAIFVEDLQSSNGTFVNGVAVKRRTQIGVGDQVAFDDVVFRVTSIHSGGADATELVAPSASMAAQESSRRPAVEELIKHRDHKDAPLDLTRRKADIRASATGGMTMAHAPVVPPAAYERSQAASRHQGATVSDAVRQHPVNKRKGKSSSIINKLFIAGLLIALLVLALYVLLIK